MSMKDDVLDMKKELQEVKQQSFAMEILQDYKKQNKRLFIIWIITFIALIGMVGYTVYLLNDIGTIEETITQETADGYNNYIGNDGEINNG